MDDLVYKLKDLNSKGLTDTPEVLQLIDDIENLVSET